MHWFQAIDDALLRLINQTWSNPFFDRLMPFASGNRYFIPALVFALLVLLWKGKTRGRLCVLMIALILWPGPKPRVLPPGGRPVTIRVEGSIDH